MQLQLRKWSGTAAEGRTSRLIIRAGDGLRLGFVDLGTGWLFMLEESLRVAVRSELDRLGVAVSGPSIDDLDNLPWLPEVYLSPASRHRIKLLSSIDPDGTDPGIGFAGGSRIRLATGEKLPPPSIGEYSRDLATITLCSAAWYEPAVGQLRRLGAVALEQDPHLGGWGPERPPRWTPGVVDPVSLSQARSRKGENDQGMPDPEVRSTVRCTLTSAAAALLPSSLESLVRRRIELSHSQAADTPRPEEQRDVDPPGYYRPWTPPRRGEVQDWEYDARVYKWPLPPGLFTPDLEGWLESLGGTYGGNWATVAALLAADEQPDLWNHSCTALSEFLRANPTVSFAPLPGEAISHEHQIEFLASRLWRRGRRRGRWWSSPGQMSCATCGELFDPTQLEAEELASLGPPRWCSRCCRSSWGILDYSETAEEVDVDYAIAAIAHLAQVLDSRPSSLEWCGTSERWRRLRIASSTPSIQRDRILLARMATPRMGVLKRLDAAKTWTQWLQLAGVMGETARSSRGATCTARDGHPCRSMFERDVDDALSALGIEHHLEPLWPWHPELNPNGLRRADWVLGDGTYVEAAGMLDDEDYRRKLAAKVDLAQEQGIPLIIVRPQDVPRLRAMFSGHDAPLLEAGQEAM